MKFDVLIYTCDNLFDAGEDGNDLIRVEGLSESDASELSELLVGANVHVCLLPYRED